MSEDDLSDCLEEPNMEIQIKTLMGTTFDIKVSAMETVADIKKKIYRIEGIPTFQQNLVFQSHLLRDFNRLVDAGITNGSTLTLVPSMKGGPISTRRLSVSCEHHLMLKELQELLENSRDDTTPCSKVTVLVLQEGLVVNILRVVENEDSSSRPRSEKPISPPSKPSRRGSRMEIFERFVEDNEMSVKISNLRKKMDETNLRKHGNNSKDSTDSLLGQEAAGACSSKSNLSFKFLAPDNIDLKAFEKSSEEDNEEEIALKDKHRSKPHKHRQIESLYGESSKATCTNIKQKYSRLNKKSTRDSQSSEDLLQTSSETELSASLAEQFGVFHEDAYSQPRPLNRIPLDRIPLARLVLSEGAETPRSSSEGIELEENVQDIPQMVQDLWEIREPVSDRLKHSATCKVGVLKRRPSLDYTIDSIKNEPKGKIGNYPCEDSDFGVCSSNLYHIPQFVSSPGSLQPDRSQREPMHDYYFAKTDRSPLYSRSDGDGLSTVDPQRDKVTKEKFAILDECSGIQKLPNESPECDSLFSEDLEDLRYKILFPSDLLGEKVPDLPPKQEKKLELPPVIKKRAKCNECNRKLNITNIHNCRCGKIFCSQHRYSEVHRCSYDYKLEGRKLLEQQNPRVAAEKIHKI